MSLVSPIFELDNHISAMSFENTEEAKPSQFRDLYKAAYQIDQNKRRQELLSEQKRRRENFVDTARGGYEEEKQKKYKNVKEYRHRIMMSEWFVEIPEDFDVSWYMKICPNGYHNLVVAEKCQTTVYSKRGTIEHKFKSVLPGGCNNDEKNKLTILDCIWNPKTKTYYVLDVLVWCNQDMTNVEAEFRFFWLQSKFTEYPEIESVSTANTYSFKYIPHINCDFLLIKNTLENYPLFENDSPLTDGLLFYHKEASYSPGRTPLVGWLKPFMVPEILNIPVDEEFMKEKPEKYVSLVEHIQHGRQKRAGKSDTSGENEMEVA